MAELTYTRDRISRRFEIGRIVKIDGLREPIHTAAAAAAGADLLGFVFAPARRRVTPETARTCIGAARSEVDGRELFTVGIFVDASLTEIEEVVRAAGIDAVQLHGAEAPTLVQRLTVPVIKALRPRPVDLAPAVVAEIERFRAGSPAPAGYVIDGYDETSAGGSGARADWVLAAEVNAVHPVLLGGGLTPENVGEAIRQVRPLGVDVSSGVEIDGVKDAARIDAFVRAARAAFAD